MDYFKSSDARTLHGGASIQITDLQTVRRLPAFDISAKQPMEWEENENCSDHWWELYYSTISIESEQSSTKHGVGAFSRKLFKYVVHFWFYFGRQKLKTSYHSKI
jgi:hypothetical protein